MEKLLRVLIIEDSEADAELIVRELARGGLKVTSGRVESVSQMLDALDHGLWDVILCDFALPQLDTVTALEILRSRELDPPFIVISGAIQDEAAVAAMKAGAHDFFRKDNLARLVPAIERELREASSRAKRRDAEQALRESQENFSKAFDAAPCAMVISRPGDGRFLEVNEAFTLLTGYTRDEAIGRSAQELKLWVDERKREEIARMLHEGQAVQGEECRFRTKSGAFITGQFSARLVQMYREQSVLSIVNDITARRAAENENLRLTTTVQQMAEMVVVTGTDGEIQYVNPAFVSTTGYQREEVVGCNPRFLKDGEQGEAFYRTLWETITSGKTWRGRLVNRKKDGTRFTVDATISPVRGEGGSITNYVAVERDVTRALALEEQLFQAQKMDSIGRLAGGIAHDFNNLLSVIVGYTDFALQDLPADDSLAEDLKEVRRASERAAALTRQLLAFSRKQVLELRPVNINQIVVEVEKLLVRILGEDVTLEKALNPEVGVIDADSGQVEQVLMNLAVNARDAMPRGGKLLIETSRIELDAESAANHPGLTPGPHVRIVVKDTGAGMNPETRARIFEPFFTTKEPGKGTGLGLSTVHGIVHQLGGDISVESAPNQGSTFEILLPRTHASRVGPEEPEQDGAPRAERPGAAILLVEDEPSVRDVARRMLEGAGYSVATASGGAEALEVARAFDGSIDLLLTDIVMPQMSGKDVAEALRRERPNLRVLYMSGYTENVIDSHGVLNSGALFLRKPLSSTELLRRVAEALRRPCRSKSASITEERPPGGAAAGSTPRHP